MAIRKLCRTAFGWSYILFLIFTFSNSCVSVKTSLIDTKLGDYVKLGLHFMTMGINSCQSHNLQART